MWRIFALLYFVRYCYTRFFFHSTAVRKCDARFSVVGPRPAFSQSTLPLGCIIYCVVGNQEVLPRCPEFSFMPLATMPFPVCLLRLRRPRTPLPALSSSPNEESLLTIPSVQPQSPSPSQLDDGVCPLTDGGAGFPLNVTPPCSGSMCSIEIFQSPMSPNSSPGFPPPESEGSRQPSCDSSLSYVGCDDEPLGDSPSTPSTVTSSSKLTKRVRFSLPLNPITTPQPLPANAPAPGSAPRRPTHLRFRVCGAAVNMRRHHRSSHPHPLPRTTTLNVEC
jgi:hypothetical protein